VVRSAALPQGDAATVRAAVNAWVEAGVTWWIIATGGRAGAFEDMRRRIHQGPPRI
jgi:hypothetical protein